MHVDCTILSPFTRGIACAARLQRAHASAVAERRGSGDQVVDVVERHRKPRADCQVRVATRFVHSTDRTLMWVAAASLMATAIRRGCRQPRSVLPDRKSTRLNPVTR